MAHNLLIKDGEASMFYVEQKPWHKLGTKLDEPATAAEAIEAASLDWDVRKVPLYACEGLNNCLLPHRYAIVPSFAWGQPKCPVFGSVGEAYQPLQNKAAFAFFDPIVGKDAAVYHTAGALGQGERIWVLAKLPGDIRVVGDDITEKYLLLSNSHDGESAVQIKFTPIRVVCQNTLTMALADGPTLRIGHHRDLNKRLEQAVSLLGIIKTRYTAIEQSFQAMAMVQVKGARLAAYLKDVFPDPDPNKLPSVRFEQARKRTQDCRHWSEYFFAQGKGNTEPKVKGTLWAAYNGVTEFTDHRDLGFGDSRRLQNVWFGNGYSIKARAFHVAETKMRVGWN